MTKIMLICSLSLYRHCSYEMKELVCLVYLAMAKVGKKNVTNVLKERLLNFFVKMHAGKGNTA